MSERSDTHDERTPGASPDAASDEAQFDGPVRDFDPRGDVGGESHSAFADAREGLPAGNDERLGERGRDPGHGGEGLIESIEADRAAGHRPTRREPQRDVE